MTSPGSDPPASPLERLVARAFPGLPWRALWLTSAATLLLVVYHHQGSPAWAPQGFLVLSESVTGIAPDMFHRHLWGHLTALVLLLAVPLGMARVAGGWTAADLGLSVRGARREMLIVLGLFGLLLPVLAIASRTDSFQAMYPRLPEARHDVTLFVLYEAAYLLKWIAWEFFFRGFLLFGLRKDIGPSAVLVSTVAFTLMHVGKPEAEMASAVLGGLVLCVIALKSRSIWPGVVIHSLVATAMDFFASSWWR